MGGWMASPALMPMHPACRPIQRPSPVRAIGVPEIAAWLAGEIEADEVLAAGRQATRNYAKRQFTWFRHQPPADWPRHAVSLYKDSINKIAIIN